MTEFRCNSCGFSQVIDSWDKCPKCGMKHFTITYGVNTLNDRVNAKINCTRVSRTLGVHPMQVEDAKKKWPGSEYDDKGRLITHSYNEYCRAAKERGFEVFA